MSDVRMEEGECYITIYPRKALCPFVTWELRMIPEVKYIPHGVVARGRAFTFVLAFEAGTRAYKKKLERDRMLPPRIYL